ncbi:MAG: thioesterase family protein [Bacteroidota bacterium]|nr:thioesterase family protein [Bacteroidota bacterium]
MEYIKTYIVKEEHIDVQNIMDGLYYPFYMEYCRHDYIREVLGFDLQEEAKKGFLLVLSEYKIQFIRSLKKGDEFTVSCQLLADPDALPKIHFKQEIICKGKIITKATFTGTCIPASGGRPYLPEAVKQLIKNIPMLTR